eukprot:TRINITY_DN8202_c0_g2_i1.p1 TRINITY_DN8202_c0_g2~~TRINITY_DN8202_c0_g2_i1.p1  ORF type:complete len:1619 (-),score=303.68 TRINITY_DN8202_c0_g2_i1:338-5194(-)
MRVTDTRSTAYFFIYLVLWGRFEAWASRAEEDSRDAQGSDQSSRGQRNHGTGQVTSDRLQARAQLHAATARLRSSASELTKLLRQPVLDLANALQAAKGLDDEKAGSRLTKAELAQRSTQVKRSLVEALLRVKSDDAAVRSSTSRTGDPLVYVDVNDASASADEGQLEDPFKPMGELAEGVASVAKQLKNDKLLIKTEQAVLQHASSVERMVDNVKDIEELGNDTGQILDDSSSPSELQNLVTELSKKSESQDPTDKNAMDSWEIDELDVETMDAFTRIKLCEIMPNLDCDACSETATSLKMYQDCVKTAIRNYTKSMAHQEETSDIKNQLEETVARHKRFQQAKTGSLFLANDALQVYGVYRNWARWNNDPMWPLEALKGEPAKAGWESFTSDSQTILMSHVNEFTAESSAIAKEEASHSAQWAYDTHAADHLTEAKSIQADAETIMGDASSMQGKASSQLDEAAKMQADAADLQQRSATTQSQLSEELQRCQNPVRCDHAEVNRLTTEANSQAAEAEDLQRRGLDQKTEMEALSQEGKAISEDTKGLQERSMTLKDEVVKDVQAPETLQSLLQELQDCATRIADRVTTLAAQHIKAAVDAILALVPDLLFACLEAALDIITGFGLVITAARAMYYFTKFAYRKWREWRDSRQQKLCAPAPQLDCCVNMVMGWHKQQQLSGRTSEAEFSSDTLDSLGKSLENSDQCAPWVVTLFTAPPADDQLKLMIQREIDNAAPSILKVPVNVWSSVTKKQPGRLLVSRGHVVLEQPGTYSFWRSVSWPAGCEHFLPIKGQIRDTEGLRAKVKAGKLRFSFGDFGRGAGKYRFEVLDEFDMSGNSICAFASTMCHTVCHQAAMCDEYLDPTHVIDLETSLARSSRNLLAQCAPVSGLAKATGVLAAKANYSDDAARLGPSALRPLVWHHIFREGRGEVMSDGEAKANAAAICDKHVLPFWTCGAEECSLCQGVSSMFASKQNPVKWCNTFDSSKSNQSDSYARDLGRFYKCKQISSYLSSTEDKNRLASRSTTTDDTCSSRSFCTKESNLLPSLNMRAGLEKGSAAYDDSMCRLCVEFTQRAASGQKPATFCKAIPNNYPQQKVFCEGALQEIMDSLPSIKEASKTQWFSKSNVTISGNSCDNFCRTSVSRHSKMIETLANPSPLMLAGQDRESAPPGKIVSRFDEVLADTSVATQSPWYKRALRTVGRNLPFVATSSPAYVIYHLNDKIQSAVSTWEGILKEISWDGSFTQKRMWPRTGPHGVITEKLEQATFLMLSEATHMKTHVSFIERIVESTVNLNVANRAAVDLARRTELLSDRLGNMNTALDSISPPSVPSKVQKINRKKARDTQTIVKCYEKITERHEKYMPVLDAMSGSMNQVVDKVKSQHESGVKYTAEGVGLLDLVSQFYLVLPKKEQGRWTRLKQWLNPLNLFRTRLIVDDLLAEDDKDCSSEAVRKMTKNGLWKQLQSCCTERRKQVLGWEGEVRTTHIQLNKILEMMNYVKGNFITRNIRLAYRAAFSSRKNNNWMQEEAVDLLQGASQDFDNSLTEERRAHGVWASQLHQLKEQMYTSVADPGVRRVFFRESRFEGVKRNAKAELRKAKSTFIYFGSLFSELAARIKIEA